MINGSTTKSQHADLSLADVLHCEVEPDSEARVAGVRPDEEVKLKLTDVVNTAKVPCRVSETAYISIKQNQAVHNTQTHWIIISIPKGSKSTDSKHYRHPISRQNKGITKHGLI